MVTHAGQCNRVHLLDRIAGKVEGKLGVPGAETAIRVGCNIFM